MPERGRSSLFGKRAAGAKRKEKARRDIASRRANSISTRGDWTPLELFHTHFSKWPDSIRHLLAATITLVDPLPPEVI
jgi:hypothetical protein